MKTLHALMFVFSFVAGFIVAHETNSPELGGIAAMHFWLMYSILYEVRK